MGTVLSDVEKTFYDHFTKRQESNNDFLIRLLVVIGSVITGYGYLLLNLDIQKYDENIVLFMVVFIEILLTIYLKVIFDEGFSFRRDQIIVYRILRKYKLIAENELENRDLNKSFNYYYNPLKKYNYKDGKLTTKNKGLLFLMPAFHNTLSFAILLLQMLIYFSFFIKIKAPFYNGLVFIFAIISFIIATRIVLRKQSWLKDLYLKEFEAISSNN